MQITIHIKTNTETQKNDALHMHKAVGGFCKQHKLIFISTCSDVRILEEMMISSQKSMWKN